MKKILNIILVVFSLSLMICCDDNESVHKEYIDKGERIYVGIPDVVIARSGYGRVELVWKLNSDPKIHETCIYWNKGEDSVIMAADRSDTVMRKIIEVPEARYTFEMINRSADGDQSLIQTTFAESFGETYKSRLREREILSQVVKPEGVYITWAHQEGCIRVDFSYLNNKGEEKILEIGASDDEILISDYKVGGEFSYTSLYIPTDNAIDTVASEVFEGDFSSQSYFVMLQNEWEDQYAKDHSKIAPESSWAITASSFVTGFLPEYMLDGDYTKFWHTDYTDNTIRPPYQIDLDMKSNREISAIEIDRRNRTHTKNVAIEYSINNEDWVDLGEMEFKKTDDGLVILIPDMVTARYIRLVLADSHDPGYLASITELVIYTAKE